MKTAIEIALDKISKNGLEVNKIEPPKNEKDEKEEAIECCAPESFYRPCIYLDDKEFPELSKYRAGDKVIMVIECNVKSLTTYDRMYNGKSEKGASADLEIMSFADITEG